MFHKRCAYIMKFCIIVIDDLLSAQLLSLACLSTYSSAPNVRCYLKSYSEMKRDELRHSPTPNSKPPIFNVDVVVLQILFAHVDFGVNISPIQVGLLFVLPERCMYIVHKDQLVAGKVQENQAYSFIHA